MTNVGKSEEQLPQKTVGRPTVGRQLANSQPTVNQQSATKISGYQVYAIKFIIIRCKFFSLFIG